MNFDVVIVGLGNPGAKYELTRHNIGFLGADHIVAGLKIDWSTSDSLSKQLNAHTAQGLWKNKNVIFLKPQTFMNLSGASLGALYSKNSALRGAQLIVLHDEVDIEFGKIKVKLGGGDAGHNGLKSLRAILGHGDYFRIRMGVGRPPLESKMDLADYVLQRFYSEEQKMLPKVLQLTEEVVEALIFTDLQAALNRASRPPG